jgi:hypothetical protein
MVSTPQRLLISIVIVICVVRPRKPDCFARCTGRLHCLPTREPDACPSAGPLCQNKTCEYFVIDKTSTMVAQVAITMILVPRYGSRAPLPPVPAPARSADRLTDTAVRTVLRIHSASSRC